jgi:hypothetical protein
MEVALPRCMQRISELFESFLIHAFVDFIAFYVIGNLFAILHGNVSDYSQVIAKIPLSETGGKNLVIAGHPEDRKAVLGLNF